MLKREGFDPLLREFKALLDQYEKYLRLCDRVVYRSTLEACERAFFARSPAHRAGMVARLQMELQLFDEAVAAGEDLTDTSQLLWRFLSRAGYVPCSDILGLISHGDVVEVYGVDQIQIFQNLNFFDWISVTLENVFCQTWYQFTRRDPSITEKMQAYALDVLAGQVSKTWAPDWPWHPVEEIGTGKCLKFNMHIKYLSPIFHGKQVAGAIVINECRKIAD